MNIRPHIVLGPWRPNYDNMSDDLFDYIASGVAEGPPETMKYDQFLKYFYELSYYRGLYSDNRCGSAFAWPAFLDTNMSGLRGDKYDVQWDIRTLRGIACITAFQANVRRRQAHMRLIRTYFDHS